MLNALMHNAQSAATRTAHTAVLGLAAGVLLTIGAGFLTLAAWLLLLTVTTALYAAVILGCVFIGAAMIVLGAMAIRKRTRKPHHAPVEAPREDIVNQLVMTFLAGITAGQKARS